MLSEVDFHRWRSSLNVNSAGGIYCNVCGQFTELSRHDLRIYLEMINLVLRTSFSLETFDPSKSYILAQGCQRCCGPDDWVLSVEDVGHHHL